MVNIYLSLRVFVKNEKMLKTMKYVNYIIYINCCAQNWLYQGYFLTTTNNIPLIEKCVYSSIIMSIIYDDWVLINFLKE